MDDRLYLLRWVDSQLIRERIEYSAFFSRYGHSWMTMLQQNKLGMEQQGKLTHSLTELEANLRELLQAGELFAFIGPTWSSVIDIQQSWHSPDTIVCEEVVGMRFTNRRMDMQDYIAAMEAVARTSEATEIQIGMLANPRKQAMLRYMTSLGMEHSTSIVSKKV